MERYYLHEELCFNVPKDSGVCPIATFKQLSAVKTRLEQVEILKGEVLQERQNYVARVSAYTRENADTLTELERRVG